MSIDPSEAAGVGSAAIIATNLLIRVFGPTADYVGEELQKAVARTRENVSRVVEVAARKLGNRLDQPGAVNVRVLKHVIDEAAFSNDEIVAEYLGGVLASSRGYGLRDDRAICYLDDIRSLSSYQLRTHFLLYASVAQYAGNLNANLENFYGDSQRTITVIFSDASYHRAMEYDEREDPEAIGKHSFLGLQNRGLSRQGLIAYDAWEGETPRRSPDEPWRFVHLTQYGHELFAWGLGLGDRKLRSYFDIAPFEIPVSRQIKVLNVELGETFLEAKPREYSK